MSEVGARRRPHDSASRSRARGNPASRRLGPVFPFHNPSPVPPQERIEEAFALAAGTQPFDLCICDEAHLTAGLRDKLFARPLQEDRVAARRRLFMTATPRIFARANDTEGLATVASMQNETLYGPVVYSLTQAEAVRRGIVVPLKLIVTNATVAYERFVAGSGLQGIVISHRNGTRFVAKRAHAEAALAVLQCILERGVSSIFSFHGSNADAEEFQQVADHVFEAAGAGDVSVRRVHGQMAPALRRRVLGEMGRGSPVLVTNARVLTTGVSVPEVDLVLLAGRQKSQISMLQAMARAARIAPGKRCGYVLVPLGSGEGGDAGAYDAMADAMAALASHDPNLLVSLQAAGRQRVAVGRELARHEWPRALQDVVDLESNVPLAAVERMINTVVRDVVPDWERALGLLRNFLAVQGHVAVPVAHEEDGVALGRWLERQRRAGRKGLLEPERLRQLSELGVDFEPAPTFDGWLARLAGFRAREGHSDVPSGHAEDGKKLGNWLGRQRSKFKAGSLSGEEEAKLRAEGFSLRMREEQWGDFLALLRAFLAREGHALVPDEHVEEGRALGLWLRAQRQRGSRRVGLRAAQRKELEALGAELDVHEFRWQRWVLSLGAFRAREGHLGVPPRHEEDGAKLGAWLARVRRDARKGALPEVRRRQLEELGLELESPPEGSGFSDNYMYVGGAPGGGIEKSDQISRSVDPLRRVPSLVTRRRRIRTDKTSFSVQGSRRGLGACGAAAQRVR